MNQQIVRITTCHFLNKCFMQNITPIIWREAIIVPIPKSASKDPCDPQTIAVQYYKYLGIVLDEHMHLELITFILAEAQGGF